MDIKCEPGVTIYLSQKCSEKLVFGKLGGYYFRIHVANSTYDINVGQGLMYVYCDIAPYGFVGDT